MPNLSPSITALLTETAERVEAAIHHLLPPSDQTEAVLFAAMRYGCLGGGKRIRPFLVLESARLFGVSADCALRTAAAVEFVHCYSLIHDDLPAMDNSDLRRGRPTVHKQFDDATAVLAGDGLLTHAFTVLADPATHEDPHVRCALVASLAHAAGPYGMVGGQMLDLIAEKQNFELSTISRLQRLKTGAIIECATTAGAILGRADPPHLNALRAYAHDLGLAFQIVDDLLDTEGDVAELGKPVGQDAVAGKATFVSILGAERARAQADMLASQAGGHLAVFGERADALRALAQFVVARRS